MDVTPTHTQRVCTVMFIILFFYCNCSSTEEGCCVVSGRPSQHRGSHSSNLSSAHTEESEDTFSDG